MAGRHPSADRTAALHSQRRRRASAPRHTGFSLPQTASRSRPATPPGAGYAAQTIRQLLPDDAWRAAPLPGAPAWELPCAEITDRPALAWRGAHIDVARHFATKRELLALVDALAAMKLNRLHLHLTDDQGWRIESALHPELHEVGSHRHRTRISLNNEDPAVYDDIPHGGYYTLADLSEIAAFARQRGMSLVPEIDLPGHTARRCWPRCQSSARDRCRRAVTRSARTGASSRTCSRRCPRR